MTQDGFHTDTDYLRFCEMTHRKIRRRWGRQGQTLEFINRVGWGDNEHGDPDMNSGDPCKHHTWFYHARNRALVQVSLTQWGQVYFTVLNPGLTEAQVQEQTDWVNAHKPLQTGRKEG